MDSPHRVHFAENLVETSLFEPAAALAAATEAAPAAEPAAPEAPGALEVEPHATKADGNLPTCD